MPIPAFVGSLIRRYPCLVCRKRAAVLKPGFCPVSGQAGVCPLAAKAAAKKAAKKAAGLASSKDAAVPLLSAEKERMCASCGVTLKSDADFCHKCGTKYTGGEEPLSKPTPAEAVKAPTPAPLATPLVMPPGMEEPLSTETARSSLVLLGRELFDKLEFVEAAKCFQGAIEENVNDWRAHYGKAEVQVAQGKYLMAFGTCRVGIEKCPGNTDLPALQESARLAYKESKNKPKVEEPVALPGCPGSVMGEHAPAVEFKKWEGIVPDMAARYNTKMMMLSIFREQWERIVKEKAKHAKAAKAATSQYTQEQTAGLSIKGGHQPMDRPENVELPDDFHAKVGVVSSKDLMKYGCENKRLLISLYGDIFDVSDRPDKYGAEGPYYFFAGRDITWGLITGADTVENCNIFYDIFKMDDELTKQKMQCICSWIAFYEVEYGEPVGRLEEFEDEMGLPQPPAMGEACVVM